MSDTRVERDSLGDVQVPADALWGAQTQRAVDNFPVSGQPVPPGFIEAVVRIKKAAAGANHRLKHLDDDRHRAIVGACNRILEGGFEDQFPVDRYQTGSGTSTNMNVNEVIANLASTEELAVSPNDHVNMGQSSNDVIPTAIHVAAVKALQNQVLPALTHLEGCIYERESLLNGQVKTGRTHLMDAMPVTLGQELRAWREQLEGVSRRLEFCGDDLLPVPQGGTAVGTGVNADTRFAGEFVKIMHDLTGFRFREMEHKFVGQSAVDAPVHLSSQLRGMAIVLMKIANDLRWMNSGPIHGLAEISLPALQPGSSIMPGKVNPVIPESVAMVAAQVMGLDSAVAIAGQSGNFQLNVMLPLVGANLLDMSRLLASSARLLGDRVIAGFTVNEETLDEAVGKNPVLVTALNPEIGYAKAAEIAKEAYASGRSIMDVAEEKSGLSRDRLEKLLNPLALTKGGLQN